MRLPPTRLVAAAATIWCATASANDWDATFPPDAVRSLLRGAQQGGVVVGAGANAAERDAAAAALTAAMRQASTTLVVMDGRAIGDASDLADDAIVKKASQLPIDRIIIVRAFPQGEGAVAVLTAYDKDGRSRAGLTARRGEALSAPTAGQGVAGLAEHPACLVVDAPDGARIFINGKLEGMGPRLTVLAMPGDYELLVMTGAGPLQRKVTFPTTRRVDLTGEPTTGAPP